LPGIIQVSVIRPLPLGVAVRFLGAIGAAALADGLAATLAGIPAPILFTALTLNVYNVPLVRPVNVWLVEVAADTQLAPLLNDT